MLKCVLELAVLIWRENSSDKIVQLYAFVVEKTVGNALRMSKEY